VPRESVIAKDKTLFQRQLADDFSIRSSVGSLAAWVEMRAPTSREPDEST